MRAKDVLLRSIEEFQGTVVFVSHDRYFIDKLATRVFEVADGAVTLYNGNYEEYLYRKSGAAEAAAAAQAASEKPKQQQGQQRQQQGQQPNKQTGQQQNNPAPAADDKQRRLNPIKLRQTKERQRGIEDEITRLEIEIADFEMALSDFQSAQQSIEIAEILEARRTDLQNLMTEWEEVSQMLEANR